MIRKSRVAQPHADRRDRLGGILQNTNTMMDRRLTGDYEHNPASSAWRSVHPSAGGAVCAKVCINIYDGCSYAHGYVSVENAANCCGIGLVACRPWIRSLCGTWSPRAPIGR